MSEGSSVADVGNSGFERMRGWKTIGWLLTMLGIPLMAGSFGWWMIGVLTSNPLPFPFPGLYFVPVFLMGLGLVLGQRALVNFAEKSRLHAQVGFKPVMNKPAFAPRE